MTLVERIEVDRKKALEDGDKLKRTVLGTLLDAVQKIGKRAVPPRDTTEAESIGAVKKMLEGIAETRSFLVKGNVEATDARHVVLNNEEIILSIYIPQQMTEEEISDALAGQPKNKGACMAYLKQNFAGNYDGKLAAQIVDRFIAA